VIKNLLASFYQSPSQRRLLHRLCQAQWHAGRAQHRPASHRRKIL